MALCEQRISANSVLLLVYKVCQIYAVKVSDNFTQAKRGKLSPTSLLPLTFLLKSYAYSTHAILFEDVSAFAGKLLVFEM